MSSENPSATVLIVDDTPANLAVVVESLESHGLRVVVAQRAQEALQRADYVQPDLILLDVMIPDLDGFEICRRLKAGSSTRNIPVIFMTSLTSVDDKVTGFAVGGVDYVTKPLHVEEVWSRVNTHLSLRAMQRELEKRNAQLQRNQEALTATNEDLEAFNHSVSHELRAPLRAINSFAQIVLETELARLTPEGRECLSKVVAASQRMGILIQDLLNYARTGRGAVRATPVLLEPLVRQVEGAFSSQIAAIGARFEVTQPLATPLGDPVLLHQTLTNLVDNALKYRCVEGVPEVRLSATSSGRQVLLQVADNGIGIDPQYRDRIFQIFQRLHTESEYPGTGIGLAIVAKAVRAMGGEVSAESSPGGGSTFSVRLPAALVAEAPS